MRPDRYTDAVLDEGLRRLVANLDEKQRRRVVGLLAAERGRGSVTALAAVTGLSRTTIVRGRREALGACDPYPGRVRVPGGGRPRAEKKTAVCSPPSMR